ncbi:hypothetical protein IC582_022152 [Cucumis melo]|uniref:UPF0496 protein At3g49070 isoform X1 n=1 Tax=Cucumis melo TaxID=3656 RepID=A0A1S3ATJ2_CUCME|nr:UPF0496 protein At3g49070 [Cucumis melo]
MKKLKIISCLRKFLSCSDGEQHVTNYPVDTDVGEEYANAFRTESYIDFWTRVVALNNGDNLTAQVSLESTTATRLSSYRLFVEHLLDPPQPTIKRMLTAHLGPNSCSLLLDHYFSHTSNASLLCSRILKHIVHLRLKLRSLDQNKQEFNYDDSHFKQLLVCLVEFSNNSTPNSFVPYCMEQVQIIQNGCSKLLKRLEYSRDKAQDKLKRVRYFQHSSAGFLVAITASFTIIVVTHGIALFVAAPGFLVGAIKLVKKSRKLAKKVAQLNVAAKGTYTLNRDFDTIGRLVARLSHELEHMRVMTKFWLDRGEDKRWAIGELLRQLNQSHENFNQQLDELEEHLYLCFMTINRARNLVVKEILDSSAPIKISYL